VKGRSNQSAVFLDSTGRTYSLPAHGLPSARGQGEPLTSHLAPVPGATFLAVLMGSDEDLYLLSTSAGYGFIVKLGDLQSRQRAGKAVVTVPEGAKVLPPVRVTALETDLLAAATDSGRLLLFPLNDLPVMPKGKGVQILSLPKGKNESLVALTPLTPGRHLIVHSGKRYLNMKAAEYDPFIGKRAQRGSVLPRGFQNVSALEVPEKS
jgi:topoisomerase-4 subunit A